MANDVRYSPKGPGIYTWPIKGEEGFYGTLYVGSDDPASCEVQAAVPGVSYEGCFSITSQRSLFRQDVLHLPTKGNAGMTVEVSNTGLVYLT